MQLSKSQAEMISHHIFKISTASDEHSKIICYIILQILPAAEMQAE